MPAAELYGSQGIDVLVTQLWQHVDLEQISNSTEALPVALVPVEIAVHRVRDCQLKLAVVLLIRTPVPCSLDGLGIAQDLVAVRRRYVIGGGNGTLDVPFA
jgi:hypothetical protein